MAKDSGGASGGTTTYSSGSHFIRTPAPEKPKVPVTHNTARQTTKPPVSGPPLKPKITKPDLGPTAGIGGRSAMQPYYQSGMTPAGNPNLAQQLMETLFGKNSFLNQTASNLPYQLGITNAPLAFPVYTYTPPNPWKNIYGKEAEAKKAQEAADWAWREGLADPTKDYSYGTDTAGNPINMIQAQQAITREWQQEQMLLKMQEQDNGGGNDMVYNNTDWGWGGGGYGGGYSAYGPDSMLYQWRIGL